MRYEGDGSEIVNEPASSYLGILSEFGFLPPDTIAAAVVGSTARGWAHSTSDVDLTVVSAQPYLDGRLFELSVPLDPATIPVATLSHDGRLWEVKFWLEQQVDQLFERISWSRFDSDRNVGERLSPVEELFLARLGPCVPLFGQRWIDERRRLLDESAFRSIMLGQHLATADKEIEAAVGQLDADNVEDAVLLARSAFEAAVEALLCHRGDYEAGPKWRAKRFRTVAPRLVSFDQFWSIQTMRNLDPAHPEKWINDVIELCQAVSMEIEL